MTHETIYYSATQSSGWKKSHRFATDHTHLVWFGLVWFGLAGWSPAVLI
jgi:hypothetical protein